jgi:hypothetical protein
MALCLGETMARTIPVCDRESDVFEYLHYKHEQGPRFVIRAPSDRCLPEGGGACSKPCRGSRIGYTKRRFMWPSAAGARRAKLGCKSAERAWNGARRRGGAQTGERGVLPVDVMLVRERGERVDALNWVLLGSEPVQEIEQVKRVRYYELRWRMRNITKPGKAAWAWSDCANQARRTWSG